MKSYIKIKKAAVLWAAIWLLSGCGQKPVYYPLAEKTESRIENIAVEDRRAPAMAADLCVITGSELQPDSSVIAEAAGVFADDGSTAYVQKNVFERLYPASTTKIMTAILALKYADLQDSVTIGDEVLITEAGASMCKIKPGDTLTMEQLLYGLMLPSGNDAASSIAVHISGSIEAFADLMNQEAQAIGAVNTHFLNPHGLHDENHYTTAYDLYLMMHEALKNPEFTKIINTSEYTATYKDGTGTEVSQVWSNSNKYLTGEREMPEGLSIIGGKTGTTSAAGYCLIMASKDQNEKSYISVIMKSDSRPHLYDGMTNIIEKILN